MPLSNLNKLFSSPFYIDGKYAESFIPLFAGVLQGKINLSASEKPGVEVSSHQMAGASENGNSEGAVVAVVSIKSPIIKFSTWNMAGTREVWSQIRKLEQDPNIAGIVLDIDSGGGQVYGTPEFFDNLKNVQKPVVAYTDGLMCSAAYYIAAASDFIIANKRADAIGSIGAYAQFFDWTGFWEKHGAKIHTVYAEKSSEKNKAFRDVMEGNYETYIKTSLNPTVDTFIADMKSARPNLSEEVFKGATWEGPEALERNLVDALGTISDAIAKVFELSASKNQSTNTTIMSKPQSYPRLQETLGLSEPLATTEDKGSYLQDGQLQAIEDQLSQAHEDVQAANTSREAAETELQTANEEHETALNAANAATVSVVASLRAAATAAGVEDLAEDASAEDIATALNSRIAELNAGPGATHTAASSNVEDPSEHSYLDLKSSIYQNQ